MKFVDKNRIEQEKSADEFWILKNFWELQLFQIKVRICVDDIQLKLTALVEYFAKSLKKVCKVITNFTNNSKGIY